MTEYEYKIVMEDLNTSITDLLNILGGEGWEMVGVTSSVILGIQFDKIYLKREIPEQ